MNFKSLVQTTQAWFFTTPERALDRAYKAALKIKEIEERHFQGKKVSAENADYGESVISYFKTEVQSYLQKINMALNVFKASRLFLNLSTDVQASDRHTLSEATTSAAIILEKLRLIDEITDKYRLIETEVNDETTSLTRYQSSSNNRDLADDFETDSQQKPNLKAGKNPGYLPAGNNGERRLESASQKTGALPRSFINTLNRIKQEIDPKSGETEEQILNRYRKSRYKTALSIKFILLIIIIPLLTHQIAKVPMRPIVNHYFFQENTFANQDLEEEAYRDLQHFEEKLHFQQILGIAPDLTPEKIEEEVKLKAQEISDGYRDRGVDAISNIFADICSFIAFTFVILTSRKEIEIVKSFFDEILYGLSDSAKAFLIILFTDMFVGFHSPHGWEVILEGIARHFGLPENREFNFLFIATFPVILDTVLKYWIFRYLNRISPSAVATYRNMNE